MADFAPGKTKADGPGPPAKVRAMSLRYPWTVGCRTGCISTAATLRQTAAAVANVKSAIHMAGFPRSV